MEEKYILKPKKFNKEELDNLFESFNKETNLWKELYIFAFGEKLWNEICTFSKFPRVSEKTGIYIFDKIHEHTKKYFGIADSFFWINRGFGNDMITDYKIPEWEIDFREVEIKYI